MRRAGRFGGRVLLILVAAVVATVGAPTLGLSAPVPETTVTTYAPSELLLTEFGYEIALPGGRSPSRDGLDPLAGYPAALDPSWPVLDLRSRRVFAQPDQDLEARQNVYCVELCTDAAVGAGYRQGSWDASDIPFDGYVTRVLESSFPYTGVPAGITDEEKFAAVQAAIWFFTEDFVLTEQAALRPQVAEIIADAIAAGPVVLPSPGLQVAAPVGRFAAGAVTGPFLATAATGEVSVSSPDSDQYADPAGTRTIPHGATVPSGTPVWLWSFRAERSVTLDFTAEVPAFVGNVYLVNSDGTDDPGAARRLVLGSSEVVRDRASVAADVFAIGELHVEAVIIGPAAGQQGPVTVAVSCDGTELPDLVVPAGAEVGAARTYTGIEAGAVCTVTETGTGALPGLTVDSPPITIVTISADTTTVVQLTNTYTAAGAPSTTTPTTATTPATTSTAPTTPTAMASQTTATTPTPTTTPITGLATDQAGGPGRGMTHGRSWSADEVVPVDVATPSSSRSADGATSRIPAALAATGVPAGGAVVLGLGLLAAGSGLLLVRRARR